MVIITEEPEERNAGSLSLAERMSKIPSYIQASHIIGLPITHIWNSEHPQGHYNRVSPKLEQELAEVALRGVVTIGAGIIE